MDSTSIIKSAKKRYKELGTKPEWRAWFRGYLEGAFWGYFHERKTKKEIKILVRNLTFAFNMLYTSSNWGSDTRSKSGWLKKEKAFKKMAKEFFLSINRNLEADSQQPIPHDMTKKCWCNNMLY
jgi:hypothetical protein